MGRRILIQGFKIAISGLLIGFLLHRLGIRSTVMHIQKADPFWLIGAVALLSTSFVAGSFQWWLLLRSEGIGIPWGKVLSFYYVGLFFNNFFISSSGGDLFRMIDVRRYSKDGIGAVSTVFLDRFMGLLILLGLAVLTAPWVLMRHGMSSQLRLTLVVLVGGWVFVLFFLFNKRFARPFAWLIQRTVPSGMVAKVRDVYRRIHDFGRRGRLLVAIVGISLFVQVARILTHYLSGRALGVSISPVTFFIIIPIVAIVASLPVSFGGLGLREQTGVVLFAGVGLSALQAFSLEFLAYLVAVVASLPGGILFVCRRKVAPDEGRSLVQENGKGVRR